MLYTHTIVSMRLKDSGTQCRVAAFFFSCCCCRYCCYWYYLYCAVLYPHILLIPHTLIHNTVAVRSIYPCDTKTISRIQTKKFQRQFISHICAVYRVYEPLCTLFLHDWCASLSTSISMYRRCATVIRLFINNMLLLIF